MLDPRHRPDDELERPPPSELLATTYRAGGPAATRAARTSGDVAAYLATRAPATYAAVADVFHQIRLAPARTGQPASVLDLGAGPGVASWAAVETWPGIATVTFVEAEPEMVRAGKTLAAGGQRPRSGGRGRRRRGRRGRERGSRASRPT